MYQGRLHRKWPKIRVLCVVVSGTAQEHNDLPRAAEGKDHGEGKSEGIPDRIQAGEAG